LDRFRHPVNVGSGAERLAGATQHHHPQLGVSADGDRPVREIANQFFIERVADVWTVERHVLDGTIASGNEMCVHANRYMRKTPKRGAAIGALQAADRPSASACLVS